LNTSTASASAENASFGETDILQSKLPGYIRSILEERFAHEGFSLDAVVGMVASVERLAFDEVVRGVELAFHLNSIRRTARLSRDDLTELLSSFLITEMLEGTEDVEKHAKDKKLIFRRYPYWTTTLLFLEDTIGSDIFQRQASSNPFGMQSYSFEDVVRMAERVSEEFGFWSNHECHEMKEMLMEMDVHGSGRVKLSEFYGYSRDGAWQFLEPSEQLRQAGSLDESSTWLGPQVMIANYINSLSNCVTTAPYYSICCLNECDRVFQQLESHVGAPSATASQIIKALESGIDAPNVTTLHRGRLEEIARVSNEQIPIHGRLLARWLHFVYPQECPYPHAPGVVKPMTQQQWLALVGVSDESVTDDEVAQHLESDFADREASPDAGLDMWNLEEAPLVSSTPSDHLAQSSPIRALVQITAQIGMLAAFLSLLSLLLRRLRPGPKTKAVEYDV
jgi:hypothetical protein